VTTETTADAVDETVLGGAVDDEQATTTEPENKAEEQPASVVPEKYELALEGMDIDADLLTAADPVFRELGLSNEQANALLPVAKQIMDKAVSAQSSQMTDLMAAQRKEWLDAFNADPDIGGANREQTVHLAGKAMDALGYTEGHPFRQLLTESGLGNHPDMIRMARRLGELVGEDGDFVRSGAGSASQVPLEKRLYPND
jgi:hypothetical protein